MYMPITEAAQALAVSEDYLRRRMSGNGRTGIMRGGIFFVKIEDAADDVGLPRHTLDLLMAGKEWLLTDLQIRNIYAITLPQLHKIVKEPLFKAGPDHVYPASPFIEFLKLDEYHRARVMER
jgi:hypothetical protein